MPYNAVALFACVRACVRACVCVGVQLAVASTDSVRSLKAKIYEALYVSPADQVHIPPPTSPPLHPPQHAPRRSGAAGGQRSAGRGCAAGRRARRAVRKLHQRIQAARPRRRRGGRDVTLYAALSRRSTSRGGSCRRATPPCRSSARPPHPTLLCQSGSPAAGRVRRLCGAAGAAALRAGGVGGVCARRVTRMRGPRAVPSRNRAMLRPFPRPMETGWPPGLAQPHSCGPAPVQLASIARRRHLEPPLRRLEPGTTGAPAHHRFSAGPA